MSQITLDIPESTLQALKTNPQEFGLELRLAAAVKFYELQRLSSGAAAELAAIPKTVFLSRLAEYGVPTFRMTEEDFAREADIG